MELMTDEIIALREQFANEVKRSIRESRSLGYAPTEFERMIASSHPVEVAKHLVISGDIQTGFKRLVAMGRKDLTFESIMLRPEFKMLFNPRTELEVASWRLNSLVNDLPIEEES